MNLERLDFIVTVRTGLSPKDNFRVRCIFSALSKKHTLCDNKDVAKYLNITEGSVRYSIKKHYESYKHDIIYKKEYISICDYMNEHNIE